MTNWIRDNFRIVVYLLGAAFFCGGLAYSLESKIGVVEARDIAKEVAVEEVQDHALDLKDGIVIKTKVERIADQMGNVFRLLNENDRRNQARFAAIEKKIDGLSR